MKILHSNTIYDHDSCFYLFLQHNYNYFYILDLLCISSKYCDSTHIRKGYKNSSFVNVVHLISGLTLYDCLETLYIAQ